MVGYWILESQCFARTSIFVPFYSGIWFLFVFKQKAVVQEAPITLMLSGWEAYLWMYTLQLLRSIMILGWQRTQSIQLWSMCNNVRLSCILSFIPGAVLGGRAWILAGLLILVSIVQDLLTGLWPETLHGDLDLWVLDCPLPYGLGSVSVFCLGVLGSGLMLWDLWLWL